MFACLAAPVSAQTPGEILAQSMAAMGGRDALSSIRNTGVTMIGYRAMVEQSERPAGPYFMEADQMRETIDFQTGFARIERVSQAYAGSDWWLAQPQQPTTVEIVNGDVASASSGTDAPRYAGGFDVDNVRDRVALGPERVLFTAEAARDLRALPDVTLHGVRHHVLAFTWNGSPVTLFINADTNLPWEVRWVKAYPYEIFLNAWGDVTTEVTFTAWSLEPNGVHFPREWTSSRVGLPDEQTFVTQLTFNAALPDGSMTVPADIYAAHHDRLRAIANRPFVTEGDAIANLADGIVLDSGSWNVGFVRQSDGIVVIEAPIDPNYAKQAFAFARQRFGLPVKAVITTSDSWPHLAGVRQAVAEGIPVYALDLNVPILQRQFAAPHAQHPDDLAQHPRSAILRPVSSATTIGTGANRLTIVPYRTITGERQMYVWFPERSLLYTSDLFAPNDSDGKTWFTPQYLDEAIGSYSAHGITPATIWGMHYGPTPYSTIVEYVKSFLNAKG